MKAVVTGGCGFVGLHIAAELSREDPNNSVLLFDVARPQFPLFSNVKYVYGDIRNPAMLDTAIAGADEVYDCAGLTERAGETVFNAAVFISPTGEVLFHHRSSTSWKWS